MVWPVQATWDSYDSECGLSPVEHTFGFAIFRGYYTVANISLVGAPMQLTPPVENYCPNSFYGDSYIQNIGFAPVSNVATMSANVTFSNAFKPQTINMTINAFTGGCSVTSYTVISGTEVYDGTTTTYGRSGHLTYSCGGARRLTVTGRGLRMGATLPSATKPMTR